ncbi:23S rRNA (pseudouridine(1915)-N(3))-methyltransferase RlmH [Mycoplasmatota bacterium]|nr:23S rRNA (pseudouridine(1915)-N(3))-methyltransferase RlmH [Mycoplasmatota bacterium]
MNIKIISVGKIKERYLIDAIKEYSKRIMPYAKLSFIEVKDEPTKDNASPKDNLKIKEKEALRILNHIDSREYVIALAIEGKQLNSIELANKIKELPTYGNSNIAFIIGGSLGLDKEILDRSNFKLSFSKMTFPHQLMKVILLEQLYRAFRINNNAPYHK